MEFYQIKEMERKGEEDVSKLLQSVGDLSPLSNELHVNHHEDDLYYQESKLLTDFGEIESLVESKSRDSLNSFNISERNSTPSFPNQNFSPQSSNLLKQKAEMEYQVMLYQKMLMKEKIMENFQKSPVSINRHLSNIRDNAPLGHQSPISPHFHSPGGSLESSYDGINPSLVLSPPPSILSNVYQVQFKMCHRFYLRDASVIEKFGLNDYVVVEADRGTDLGMIVGVLTTSEFMEYRNRMRTMSFSIPSPRRILRAASPVEQMNYLQKARDEEEAVEFANMLASTIHQLPLVVCDAEYQFDRNKLTVYYQSSGRVDFREMVRDMFAMFKVRIWMEKVEPTTTSGIYGY